MIKYQNMSFFTSIPLLLQGRDVLRYNCRCSCLEIYNETITDLLNPSATNLQLREDPSRGIYVDGLAEKEVLNGVSSLGGSKSIVGIRVKWIVHDLLELATNR